MSSYRYDKKVDRGLRDVADLKANGVFEMVAEEIPAGSGVPRPSEPTVGLESTFNKNKSSDERAVDIFNALSQKRERVENWGYYVIGSLLNACLLEDKDDCVRMHDVIRDMALWIASDIERDEQNFFVQTGAQLSKAPEVGKWEGFFQSMPNLTVLDLSNNISLLGLPRDVCKLVSLQYLNLSLNRHKGAANRVESIGKVEISEPGEAEDCILSRDESLVDELQCLKELNVLTVTIRSAAALERLSSFQRMQSSTRALHLELFP
ncbi:hypothetical protein OIU79_023255 [Salix purpurea]|uniref:Uncharacterized protein n=1 Tax=Salix purpurea TaxID=77065 RepID=A0A9Q0NR36_SALPP|nr:hypothetical protein OIU79_023255 [Salix purpurea]